MNKKQKEKKLAELEAAENRAETNSQVSLALIGCDIGLLAALMERAQENDNSAYIGGLLIIILGLLGGLTIYEQSQAKILRNKIDKMRRKMR